jgi:WD40 repeat protein
VSLLRNRYRIIQPLGGGGFGRTFLAEDEDKLKEQCVVKQLVPQVHGTGAMRKAIELFQEEARHLQELGEHPQIPTLYAYFSQDNYLYLVQQLIKGQTLQQELKQQGSFNEEKIWRLLSELLPVLQFVHEHHVVHRDIKPENIIRRSPQGDLVLIDFGVAKLLTGTAPTQPGTSIGSQGYAPMEQMKYGHASPASDLFSLGVTCFHLLTGVYPFHLYLEQGYGWVTHWRKYLKSPISPQLEQVLDKLLQKDLDKRYQFTHEVLHELSGSTPRNFSATKPPSRIIPKTLISSRGFFQKINQLKNPAVVGIAILVLGLAGYRYWQSFEPFTTLTGHLDEVNSLALIPQTSTFASASDDKTIKLWDLNTRKEIRTLRGHSDWIYSVAISPNGQTIVSGGKDDTIKVWNLNTGNEKQTLRGHKSFVNSVAISPDGRNIASGSYDTTIKIWDLKTGGEIRTLKGHSSAVLCVAFGLDGQTLISGSADRKIKVWNFNTAKEIRTMTGHSGDVNALAISPNGDLLVSTSDDKTIKVWNPNTGREIRTLTGHSANVQAVAFSPDGKMIATGSDDQTVKIWNLRTGAEVKTLTGHSGEVFAVAFSPDAKKLLSASADKTIKIWRLSP